MNNTSSTNYPYLAGYLSSALRNLGDDLTFLSFKKNDYEGRAKYIAEIIREANEAAAKFEAQWSAR
jgi:hypothetical protein